MSRPPLLLREGDAVHNCRPGTKIDIDDIGGPRIFEAHDASAYRALGGQQCLICEMPRKFCTLVVCRTLTYNSFDSIYWREVV